MRIAHVLDGFGVGGAEVLVLQLCRMQKEAGHQPSAHGLLAGGPIADELSRLGVPVFVHGGRNRAHMVNRARLALRNSDAVHCHNLFATVFGAPAARLAGVRKVISTRHGLVYPIVSQLSEFKYWQAARLCRRVVAVCEAAGRNLRGNRWADPAKVVRIYNGANPPAGVGARPPKDGWTVIQLGRLAEPKDPFTLLRAAKKALARIPDLRLWFVGDGKLRPSAEQLSRDLGIESAVTFWGTQKNVGDFLSQSDLFVLSSKSEGLPVSELEAMALGLPILVTNVGGMPEVLPRGEAGCAVPAEDPDRLAEQLIAFSEKRNLKAEWAPAIKAHYQENFRLETMAEAYLRLYGE